MLAHLTVILALRAITAVVLSVLDAPVGSSDAEQALGPGFVAPQTGDRVVALGGVFDDLPPAQFLTMAIHPHDLGDARQAEGLRVGVHHPKRSARPGAGRWS